MIKRYYVYYNIKNLLKKQEKEQKIIHVFLMKSVCLKS